MATENKPEKTKTENSQKEKALLLKILVLSFTVLIFAAWIFNLQSRLKNVEDLTLVPKNDEFVEIKDNLDQVVDDLSTKLKNNKDNFDEVVEDIKESAQKNEKEDNLNLSPTIDPLSEPSLSNCPQYINCMPTFDGPAKSCVIPPGCEEITQVVW